MNVIPRGVLVVLCAGGGIMIGAQIGQPTIGLVAGVATGAILEWVAHRRHDA